jgi:uncharacterized membrane protein
MSADEGASWAAADAGSIGEVIALQRSHNAGKLPIHDVLLHEWIAIFGDGLTSMRSLSALFGLIAVALMFPVTRELLGGNLGEGRGEHLGGASYAPSDLDVIAALATLITAVSLVTIKYSREMRMYSLLLAFALAQIWFFMRALRRNAIADYVILAALTILLVLTNLIAIPLVAVEGFWLLMIIATNRSDDDRKRRHSAIATGVTISLALLALAPTAIGAMNRLHQIGVEGKLNWLQMPRWWAPVSLFSKATGSFVFPVMMALAAWGVVRCWKRANAGARFAILWMLMPPVLLLIASHLVHPVFVERYLLYCFPAFFILTAIGIWELGADWARILAAAIIVLLALGHIHSYSMKTHDTQWSEATRSATANLPSDKTIAVIPPFAVEVVRYYSDPSMRARIIPYDSASSNLQMIILSNRLVHYEVDPRVRHDYPKVLARERDVVVLSR